MAANLGRSVAQAHQLGRPRRSCHIFIISTGWTLAVAVP